ncbi:invasion associated locus B family protein [Coralliovum pocilloporae]|uniref:invasion associated locus B family protein n=1 Tax=Coralliovum pocilloporae TaxID=3066369 RepID=UPI0033071A10
MTNITTTVSRLTAIFSATLMAGAFAAGTAAAQEAGAPGWTKICNVDQNSKKEICLTTRELRAQTGQFLASVAIREFKGEARKSLIISVPPGMLLVPGLRYQVDANKQGSANYGICFPNACYAEKVIDDSFITQLKKGNKLVITALNQRAKGQNFELSLSGFTKTIEGDPVDPKVLQERQKKLQEELQRRAEEQRQKLLQQQNAQ